MTETPCPHEQFRADVDVHRIEEGGRFFADIRIVCAQCQEPFRFIGVKAGLNFAHPTCSIDGLELNAPIEPEIVKVFQHRAEYRIPPPEGR